MGTQNISSTAKMAERAKNASQNNAVTQT